MSDELSIYAHEIARQEGLIASANEVYQAAKKEAETLKKRIDTLKSEHDAIIKIRANGGETEENENRLVVLSSDLRGLAPLLEKANAEAVKAMEPVTLHKQYLQRAKDSLVIAEAQAEFEALTAKARKIEELLINVVKAAHEAGKRSGSPYLLNNYKPPNTITRLIRDRVLPQ